MGQKSRLNRKASKKMHRYKQNSKIYVKNLNEESYTKRN